MVELKAYKTALQSNPACLMVQDVSNRYIELLNQSASSLEKITNDANLAKNEQHEEDSIANSNICLFVHIIKLIRESAKNWNKISEVLGNLMVDSIPDLTANVKVVTDLESLLENLFWALGIITK